MYVGGGDALVRFDRDREGALTFRGCISSNSDVRRCAKIRSAKPGGLNTGLSGISGIALSPDGRRVFANSPFGDALSYFSRKRSTGALRYGGCVTSNKKIRRCTKLPGATSDGRKTALDGLGGVLVSADGKQIYAAGFIASRSPTSDPSPQLSRA